MKYLYALMFIALTGTAFAQCRCLPCLGQQCQSPQIAVSESRQFDFQFTDRFEYEPPSQLQFVAVPQPIIVLPMPREYALPAQNNINVNFYRRGLNYGNGRRVREVRQPLEFRGRVGAACRCN